jgi:EAL domain-containing protein (putative c-di-GMP-specific phosphodiesterase class I)
MGGDEFTLLLEGLASAEDARVVAERLQQALLDPVMVDDIELFVTASIGVAMTDPVMTPDDIVRNADIAMYDAKHAGRGRVSVFDQSMHRRAVERMARENDLRLALEGELLQIHYQPIIELSTGRIRFLEALARWPLAWSEVEPEVFIPIAEDTGLIGMLGLQVLRGALRALAGWRQVGLVDDDTCVSVNVSARQIDDPNLPDDVLAAIADAGLPPRVLRLEVTESMLIQEPQRIERLVEEVCSAGVGLHLDDYGTGYSSLAVLHELPVDTLKIDRHFVRALAGEGGDGRVVIRSTIALAHSLGLQVVAEGIESVGQAQALRALGCDFGQGFLVGEPLPPDELEPLLARWKPEMVTATESPTPASR